MCVCACVLSLPLPLFSFSDTRGTPLPRLFAPFSAPNFNYLSHTPQFRCRLLYCITFCHVFLVTDKFSTYKPTVLAQVCTLLDFISLPVLVYLIFLCSFSDSSHLFALLFKTNKTNIKLPKNRVTSALITEGAKLSPHCSLIGCSLNKPLENMGKLPSHE